MSAFGLKVTDKKPSAPQGGAAQYLANAPIWRWFFTMLTNKDLENCQKLHRNTDIWWTKYKSHLPPFVKNDFAIETVLRLALVQKWANYEDYKQGRNANMRPEHKMYLNELEALQNIEAQRETKSGRTRSRAGLAKLREKLNK
jgi:hypothetical protein